MILNSYTKTINEYIQNIKFKLKDNLELIYIIGSSATDNVVENWSDIDCIIVLKKYTQDDIEIIKELSNNFDVKIGNTIYSKEEFESGLVDPKTYYYLLLQKDNILDFQYKSETLVIPKVNYDKCNEITKTILTIDLHNCKRLLTYKSLETNQTKTLFKKIYVIMKSMLIINNYKPKNYKETFELFTKVFGFEYFDYLKFIADFKENNVNIENLKDYAFKLIGFVSQSTF